jgi:hypothetical protein
MSKIFYNGFEILENQATPFVSRVPAPIFRGDSKRLGVAENYTLNGLITGCFFTDVTGSMSTLSNIFSKDFGTFIIDDQNGFLITKSGTKVLSIDFPVGNEVGLQEYVVNLQSYPESFFENAGIIEKRNDWSISNDTLNNLKITHSIFAKGKNTSPSYDNALANAKNFVLTLTGFNPPPLFPIFISGISGSLDSRTENINRLDGSYQITENYIGSSGSGITEDFNIQLESGTDGIIFVSVQGNLKAGNSSNFNILRQRYSGINPYFLATGVYNHYRGITGLRELPLSSGVTESYVNNTLDFNVEFNDWPDVLYKHDYTVQLSSGNDGIITASINGDIEGLGKLPQKYDRAYNFYTGLDIFSLVNPEYLLYVGTGYPYTLRNIPITSGTSTNRFAGQISYNATFDNRTLPLNCSGIKIFDVTINKQLPIRAISPLSIPHSIQGLDTVDLNYKSRGTINAQGNITVEKPYTTINATGFIAQYINNKFISQFLITGKTNLRLDKINLSQDINNNGASFDIQWSFDEALSYNAPSNYIFITGLTI